MLHIITNTINEAWRTTLTQLYLDDQSTDNKKYYRDEPTLIEINKPFLQALDPAFPMQQKQVDIINNFIITGKQEDLVEHEWSKIYYHRMFDEPNSQIKYLLERLRQPEPSGHSQISLWDKTIDQTAEISPCAQIIWARTKFSKLEMHVHSHSSDAYKKLLMNLNEFVSLQHYLANELSLEVGKYYHFIDSCHLLCSDLVKFGKIIELK